MELNTIESEMLIDIYDADMMPEMPFEIGNYRLIEEDPEKKIQEFAYRLKKLKMLGLVKYEERDAFIKGGSRSAKYNNNVTTICGDKIHINSKGIKLVEGYKYSNSENTEKYIIND
ncbi:hypothetical protein [Clostridium lacusfryxellense]|uniref:hypothetical protein n=1 Tax=Clostridium lacusfryxellense TaxID=205328 RepID=UPI001C0DD5CC|nr:hypothetical protein [Clostridium lacusfryxellense]MBU3113827.1 hypothetical protein [Clostridium lacusfryxellense]